MENLIHFNWISYSFVPGTGCIIDAETVRLHVWTVQLRVRTLLAT